MIQINIAEATCNRLLYQYYYNNFVFVFIEGFTTFLQIELKLSSADFLQKKATLFSSS